jgi:CRISPR-associated protein Cmr2
MQRDYYTFQRAKLDNSLNALVQAARELEAAKKDKRDKQASRQAVREAETKVKKAATEAVKIEPHLTYLWFEACNSELANSIRNAWQEDLIAGDIPKTFRFTPESLSFTHLPLLSWMLFIPFRLQKPYLCKGDRDFHLLDNPLRKEKVFQVPMVASTSWKGALRAALWQLSYKEDHPVTIRLLGNPRESEEQQAGRLYFFPTFFDKIGLEVINPHDRTTGVGARGPILMECVPQGTKGELFLLYVPFGPIGQSENDRRAEVAEDLRVICKGVQAMLITYGFGAKTSSGFSVAKDKLAGEGKLIIRADLRREVGTLKSEAEYQAQIEGRGQKHDKERKQLYKQAKNWWEREGQALVQAAGQEPEPEPAPPEQLPVAEYTFGALSELCEVARRVAEQLQEGGAA